MSRNFMQQLRAGLLKDPFDAFEEAVDAWHIADIDLPVHEYLGMTLDEYQTMMECSEELGKMTLDEYQTMMECSEEFRKKKYV